MRIETLAAKAPGHIESALAIARAAIDASEFERARAALARFIAVPTQRVALLMAEIERTEHGDSGRARAWTLRAVRALHDPVWTADGYVSDRWRPVSPVSGRLDAFQWQTPLAALPSDRSAAIEFAVLEEEMLAPPRRIEPPEQPAAEAAEPPAAQDNSPASAKVADQSWNQSWRRSWRRRPNRRPRRLPRPRRHRRQPESPAPVAAPLFRTRHDIPKPSRPASPR